MMFKMTHADASFKIEENFLSKKVKKVNENIDIFPYTNLFEPNEDEKEDTYFVLKFLSGNEEKDYHLSVPLGLKGK